MTVALHLATCNTPYYSLLKLHTPDMKQDIHNHAEVDFIIDITWCQHLCWHYCHWDEASRQTEVLSHETFSHICSSACKTLTSATLICLFLILGTYRGAVGAKFLTNIALFPWNQVCINLSKNSFTKPIAIPYVKAINGDSANEYNDIKVKRECEYVYT